MQLPSLRKTVHLVAPGWNVIGAGEPALPGVALGHNEDIASGFTIVGIDQQDLYVEKVNPENSNAVPGPRRTGKAFASSTKTFLVNAGGNGNETSEQRPRASKRSI